MGHRLTRRRHKILPAQLRRSTTERQQASSQSENRAQTPPFVSLCPAFPSGLFSPISQARKRRSPHRSGAFGPDFQGTPGGGGARKRTFMPFAATRHCQPEAVVHIKRSGWRVTAYCVEKLPRSASAGAGPEFRSAGGRIFLLKGVPSPQAKTSVLKIQAVSSPPEFFNAISPSTTFVPGAAVTPGDDMKGGEPTFSALWTNNRGAKDRGPLFIQPVNPVSLGKIAAWAPLVPHERLRRKHLQITVARYWSARLG